MKGNQQLATELFLKIYNRECSQYGQSLSYPEAIYLEKQVLHVFFWLLIPEYYRASYLNHFSEYERELVISYEEDDLIKKLRSSVMNNQFNLSIYYEYIISLDLVIKGEEVVLNENKASRDNYGAYYTPDDLANNMVNRVLDTIEEHPRRVIDLSCGCGIFLKKYAMAYLDKYGDTKENRIFLSENLYGVDVDLIALLISAFEIAQVIEVIPKHLILGNPLIKCDNSSYVIRKNLFFKNLIYDVKMGLPEEFYCNEFDVILGNPPWEKVRFEERKFFSNSAPKISELSLKKDRAVLIEKLLDEDSKLYSYYLSTKETYEGFKKIVRNHPLLSNSLSGELNTYAMFTELAFHLLSSKGIAGLIVKASLVKTPTNSNLIKKLNESKAIEEIDVFSNRKKIFQIDSREEFCVIYLSAKKHDTITFKSNIEDIEQLDTEAPIHLSINTLYKINPSSGLLPNVNSSDQLNFLIKMYNEHPIFESVYPQVKFGRLVHLTNHSDYIMKYSDYMNVPVYEGKFIEQFDGRYSGFQGVLQDKRYTNKASAKKLDVIAGTKPIPESRYFIESNFWDNLSKNYRADYMLVWRSLTSPSNRRTMISTIIPFMPTSQSIQFLLTQNNEELIILNALFNSIIFDYLVRLKMPGIDLTQSVIKNIPVPDISKLCLSGDAGCSIKDEIIKLVGNLYASEYRLDNLFSDSTNISYDKKEIMAKIDILFATAYGITDEELNLIVRTFPSFYSKNELDLYF